MSASDGLVLFIVVILANVLGLGLDLLLDTLGLTTVTDVVRSGTSLGRVAGASIVTWQVLGTVGLVRHFMG